MCNCLKDITERIQNDLPSKTAAYANMKIKSVSFDNVGIIFDSKQSTQMTYPVTIIHEPIGRKTKTTINFTGKYCPFCGIAYDTEAADDEGRTEKALETNK